MSPEPLPTGTPEPPMCARYARSAQSCRPECVIETDRIEGLDHHLVKTVSTNADGRIDARLLAEWSWSAALWNCAFHAGIICVNRRRAARSGVSRHKSPSASV